MKIKILKKEEIDRVIAEEIITLINSKNKVVLGLATGSSPIGVYDLLVKAYQNKEVSFKNVISFNLDEYLNIDIEIIGCPIIREEDGLAKSSRNTYLSLEERKVATILNKSLKLAKEKIQSGERNAVNIIEVIENNIKSEKLAKIDYIEIVDSNSLEEVKEISKSILVAIAVFIGKTRLIDNFTYEL